MLRPLALLLLVPALGAQAPAANFEVTVPDLQALLSVSGSLPAARALAEPEMAGYLTSELGVENAGEFVAGWVEGYLPGVDWTTFADGVRALRVQGLATKAGDGSWAVARLTTASSEVAGAWFARIGEQLGTPGADPEATSQPPTFPAELEGARWLRDDLWLTREGADLVLGHRAPSLEHGLRAFGEPLGASLLAPIAGAVPVVEARGRFGLLLESLFANPTVPGGVATWFDGLGDAHAHARMDAHAPEGDRPGRLVTRLRRDPASATQTNAWESSLGVQPLDPAWLKGLPTGAMFTCVTTMDAARAIPAMLDGGEQAGLEAASVDWNAVEAELGFPLDRIWTRMGPRVTFWTEPLAGPAIPPTFATIGLDDPEAFRADWDALLGVLAASSDDFELNTRDYKVKDAALGARVAIPITTIRSNALSTNVGGFDLSANPAMCIDDGTLIVSSSSSRLKKELKRRHEGEAELGLDLSARLAGAGFEGATTAWQFDFVAMLDGLLGLARLLGGMGGDMVPVDLSSLPTTAALAKHVRPTFHAQGVDEHGRWILHEASFGPETWLALAGAVQRVMEGMDSMMDGMAAESGLAVGGALPGAVDPAESTRTAFDDLRVGLTVHQIATGALPAKLDDLLTKTSEFPSGYLDAGVLPLDGWGHAFRYELVSPEEFRLWSVGPDGVDQTGGGDDLVAVP